MKFSHCHVDIAGTEVGADLGSCQSSMMKLFAKKNPSQMFLPIASLL